jgi:hypothetical protein
MASNLKTRYIECMELYLHSPICLHGMVLNYRKDMSSFCSSSVSLDDWGSISGRGSDGIFFLFATASRLEMDHFTRVKRNINIYLHTNRITCFNLQTSVSKGSNHIKTFCKQKVHKWLVIVVYGCVILLIVCCFSFVIWP